MKGVEGMGKVQVDCVRHVIEPDHLNININRRNHAVRIQFKLQRIVKL